MHLCKTVVLVHYVNKSAFFQHLLTLDLQFPRTNKEIKLKFSRANLDPDLACLS